MNWHPTSWQQKPALQQPNYPDAAALESTLQHLKTLPPLVTSWEVLHLKNELAAAYRGERFILQGGDCAESFADCQPQLITNRLKVLLQMSLVLTHGLKKRVTRIGRIAGQYAKPRSSDMESKDGISLPSYRGDIVNAPAFTEKDRTPDPARLLQGHNTSALTMNFVRGLIDGGFADLHHPEFWGLDWVQHSPLAVEYQARVDAIGEALRFMETLAGAPIHDFERVDFYTSHEALVLHYEQAQTRTVPRHTGYFNLSTHFPWIGLRTAQLDGAHVEYCKGLQNPIGVKVGAGMDAAWLKGLCEALNPQREVGKLVFIHRFGAAKIADHLPKMLDVLQGEPIVWLCDPMHGNTQSTSNGYKTRAFEDVASEVEQAFALHRAHHSRLHGVHLELTGEDVTECIGGARGLVAQDLERAYTTTVDPRLNYEQALELALKIVKWA